jgi:hypothetical protein
MRRVLFQVCADIMPRQADTGEYILLGDAAAKDQEVVDMTLYEYNKFEKVVLGMTGLRHPAASTKPMLSHMRKYAPPNGAYMPSIALIASCILLSHRVCFLVTAHCLMYVDWVHKACLPCPTPPHKLQ